MSSIANKIVNLNVQLLHDKTTGIIVFIATYGGGQLLPDVSEELDFRHYRSQAPYGVFLNPLDYVVNAQYLIESRPENISEEDLARTRILSMKAWAIARLCSRIFFQRMRYAKDLPLQEEIYQAKIKEAQSYREEQSLLNGLVVETEERSNESYPYLTDYAEIEGITLAQAVDLVLFKEDERQTCLRVTEHNRLLWSKRLRECKTVEEITEIVHDLQKRRMIVSSFYSFA